MNKEQLIEWFIENYGSHPLLAQFISVAEIRQRLNENIKEVTYEPEQIENRAGSYNGENGIINIDLQKSDKAQVFVHEILHALTYSKSEYSKTGLQIQKKGTSPFENIRGWSYISNEAEGIFYKEIGRGINEGITDWLAEEITGVKNEGYTREKITARILFGLVGKENVLAKFFDQDCVEEVIDDFTLEEFFSKEICKRYARREWEISTIVLQLTELQDTLTILESITTEENKEVLEEQRKMHEAARKEIVIASNDLITSALEGTNDISLKKELLKGAVLNSNFTTMFPQNEIIEGAFKEFLETDELSTEEKMEIVEIMAEKRGRMDYHKFGMIEEFLFQTEETSKAPMNQRIYQYLRMAGTIDGEKFLIEANMINKADFSKGLMILNFLEILDLNKSVYGEVESLSDLSLADVAYQRIGNHYELTIQNADREYTYLLEGIRYDKMGWEVTNSYVLAGEIDGEPTYHGKGTETQQWKRIEEQIRRIQEETNKSLDSIEIIGNDVTMRFIARDESGKIQKSRENYTIGEDGKLEAARVGEVRRLTDDMSKLDIQLMEEAAKAGVTTSQMIQVADAMKANLKEGEIVHKVPEGKGED